MGRLSSHVAADVMMRRPATILRVIGLGRVAIIWDTRQPVVDRRPGGRAG